MEQELFLAVFHPVLATAHLPGKLVQIPDKPLSLDKVYIGDRIKKGVHSFLDSRNRPYAPQKKGDKDCCKKNETYKYRCYHVCKYMKIKQIINAEERSNFRPRQYIRVPKPGNTGNGNIFPRADLPQCRSPVFGNLSDPDAAFLLDHWGCL